MFILPLITGHLVWKAWVAFIEGSHCTCTLYNGWVLHSVLHTTLLVLKKFRIFSSWFFSWYFHWRCWTLCILSFERKEIYIYIHVSAFYIIFQWFTLNVWGLSYLSLIRSISWLLMPWLLTWPGHQQPWYWLYRICRSFSYLRNDFEYLCQINVEEWHKMQIYVYVPSEKFSTLRKGLNETLLSHMKKTELCDASEAIVWTCFGVEWFVIHIGSVNVIQDIFFF